MKESLKQQDWDSLYASVHKLIPSFSIVGIHNDYENIAKKIQEYTSTRQHLDEIEELVLKIIIICSQACKELEVEIKLFNNIN